MSLFEISSISKLSHPRDLLLQGHIDSPKEGDKVDSYALNIVGWVRGKEQPPVAIEFSGGEIEARQFPVILQPKGATAALANGGPSAHRGYRFALSVLPFPRDFHLKLAAVFHENIRVPFATIQGKRQAFRTNNSPRLNPIIMTNLGRCGSTWLTALLGQHPNILVYQPFRYEPRVGSYWMEVFGSLSEPRSYLETIRGEIQDKHWWTGENRQAPWPLLRKGERLEKYLTRTAVESLAALCQERIESFYDEVALEDGKSNPEYFAERYYGKSKFAMRVMWELYPKTREVIMIRDFRDMVCSMLAFNKKTGLALFGRGEANSDEEYIRNISGSIAGLLHSWKNRQDRAFLLRYEDLIGNPEKTFQSLAHYLGVDARLETVQEVFRRAIEFAPERQTRHKTTRAPNESIGRWRRDLDPALQAACADSFGEILDEFGYTV